MTTMTPDYDAAAIKATETLIRFHVTSTPIAPLPILKNLPRVLMLSFAEMAKKLGIDREALIQMFSDENRDVVTCVVRIDGELWYMMTFNQRLPFYMLQRAMARELGHIMLGHDGSRTEEVRDEEAACFARHFLCPRPLIKGLMDAGVQMTTDTVGNITGCYERCMKGIRRTPGTHVPASLNRELREQFGDYISNYKKCRTILPDDDDTQLVDFGTYFDNYEE